MWTWRAGCGATIRQQFGQFRRVGQQQLHAIAVQVGRGEIAANKQGRKTDAQLLVVQLQAFGLLPRHVAEQVIPGARRSARAFVK